MNNNKTYKKYINNDLEKWFNQLVENTNLYNYEQEEKQKKYLQEQQYLAQQQMAQQQFINQQNLGNQKSKTKENLIERKSAVKHRTIEEESPMINSINSHYITPENENIDNLENTTQNESLESENKPSAIKNENIDPHELASQMSKQREMDLEKLNPNPN